MLRSVLFILLSVVVLHAGEAWPGVEFTEVRAYAWPAKLETESVVLKDMALAPGVLNKDGTPLTAAQTKRLLATINGKHPSHVVAACYVPHNAFLFYNAERKPVAYLEICFGCFNYQAEPELQKQIALPAIAALVAELKLPLGEDANLREFQKRWGSVNGKK